MLAVSALIIASYISQVLKVWRVSTDNVSLLVFSHQARGYLGESFRVIHDAQGMKAICFCQQLRKLP